MTNTYIPDIKPDSTPQEYEVFNSFMRELLQRIEELEKKVGAE